ncbi:MAG: phage/plasmid primase, P4 family [Ruminococcus sp.]|nr:phage/plasmid primase, P4 family [Ruminococcus sp.]
MHIDEILQHFQGVKQLGRGHYKVLCPCHDDHEPSLDICEKNGKILMACPVCEADGKRIMETLNLPVRELFAEQRRSEQTEKPSGVDYYYTDSLKKSRYYVWNNKKQDYKKCFCWYHKNGSRWVKGLPKKNGRSILPPLYKQNNVQWAIDRGKTLYIVEGEKDVDTLTQKLHLPAVCSPHGAANAKNPAKKWDETYNILFKGADVAVIPDNDEAGLSFARYVAGQLLPVAKSVKVLGLIAEWKGLPTKGDITDVYEHESPISGKTIAETVALRLEALKERTAAYVPMEPAEEAAPTYPIWTSGEGDSRKLNERLYVTDFIEQKQVRCINNKLYSVDGAIEDGKARQMIALDILPYVKSNHGDKAEKLLRSIKALCYTEPPKPDTERLHFANGTLSKDKDGLFTVFSEEKDFRLNRFPVKYDPNAPKPERFLRYLQDVYQGDDQITIQQYCGYCLLPTTILQKALIIIGEGGEGKSVLGAILNGVIGEDNCYNESISTLQKAFGVANVEGKLLFIDDDLSESALTNARMFKNLVTNKTTISAQKKFVQDNQILSFVRFVCFGNFTLQALYDLSEGFQRRQLILQAKPKEPDRVDNPFIDREILENEAEGVMMWLLEGLNALIQNNWQITVSERTKEKSDSFKRENDSVLLFLTECRGICIEEGERAHSRMLFTAYERFCDENALTALREQSFLNALRTKGRQFQIHRLDNPFTLRKPGGSSVLARGFEGIGIRESYIYVSHCGMP